MTNRILQSVRVLAKIADAYDANELDDEARKFWGKDLEITNGCSAQAIELYCSRGGRPLLTLQDCLEAREALRIYDSAIKQPEKTMSAEEFKSLPRG